MSSEELLKSVVICFKFSNFAYANTVLTLLVKTQMSLLFALNLVTLLMQIQFKSFRQRSNEVVICFKFSNFAYANTVLMFDLLLHYKLLFALNLVTLLMQIQFEFDNITSAEGCYLL